MQNKLSSIIQNQDKSENKREVAYHAFVFVYDASDRDSFKKTIKIIEAIRDQENSKRKGLKSGSQTYFPKKIILGNKKDMKLRKQVLQKKDF